MANQHELWNKHYNELMQFVNENKRRPSKHNEDEHQMLCWIKYNKKKYKRGTMLAERVPKFVAYLALADKYRRYNAMTYANPKLVEEERDKSRTTMSPTLITKW